MATTKASLQQRTVPVIGDPDPGYYYAPRRHMHHGPPPPRRGDVTYVEHHRHTVGGAAPYGGYGYTWGWHYACCWVAAIFLTLLLVGGFALLVWNRLYLNNLDNVQRFCLAADGDQVEPGPGDANGRARGSVTLDRRNGRISWDLLYLDTAEPTDLTVHGPLTEANPSTVGAAATLNVDTASGTDGSLAGTVMATPALIDSILAAPAQWYVLVANGPFPDGALRGALDRRC